jgi:hypothetical protein
MLQDPVWNLHFEIKKAILQKSSFTLPWFSAFHPVKIDNHIGKEIQ